MILCTTIKELTLLKQTTDVLLLIKRQIDSPFRKNSAPLETAEGCIMKYEQWANRVFQEQSETICHWHYQVILYTTLQ